MKRELLFLFSFIEIATRVNSQAPPEWTCDPFSFDSGDGCHCNCGAADPDCLDASSPVFGCDDGETCSGGLCILDEDGDGIPDDWECDPIFYNTNSGCDCECGAPDPDCLLTPEVVFGCFFEGERCINGRCSEFLKPSDSPTPEQIEDLVPDSWSCRPAFYNSSDGCDCECGAVDPDCFETPEIVFNCFFFDTICVNDVCTPYFRPTFSPTNSPTISPSSSPSISPTFSPTLSPSQTVETVIPTATTPAPSDEFDEDEFLIILIILIIIPILALAFYLVACLRSRAKRVTEEKKEVVAKNLLNDSVA